MHDYGVAFDLPVGWNTRFYKIVEPVVSPVMIQAATIPFVEDDLSAYQADTCTKLGPKDAIVIAQVYDPSPPDQVWPPLVVSTLQDFTFATPDFAQIQGLPRNQIQARKSIVIANRMCEI